jgi:DNA-binding transcriptional regulator of glucitol operon
MVKKLKFVKILMCPVCCCVHCVVIRWEIQDFQNSFNQLVNLPCKC